MSLALRYAGTTLTPQEADEELLSVVPADLLVHRMPGLFELAGPPETADALLLPEGWVLYEPTYAEINPPGISLAGMRKRLAELKGDDA